MPVSVDKKSTLYKPEMTHHPVVDPVGTAEGSSQGEYGRDISGRPGLEVEKFYRALEEPQAQETRQPCKGPLSQSNLDESLVLGKTYQT